MDYPFMIPPDPEITITDVRLFLEEYVLLVSTDEDGNLDPNGGYAYKNEVQDAADRFLRSFGDFT